MARPTKVLDHDIQVLAWSMGRDYAEGHLSLGMLPEGASRIDTLTHMRDTLTQELKLRSADGPRFFTHGYLYALCGRLPAFPAADADRYSLANIWKRGYSW